METKLFAKVCLMAIPAITGQAYAQAAAAASPGTVVAIIDATKVSEPISKYEYGMFIEHIGSLIYRSLWSEMLDDRKFYYPISSKEPESAGRGQGGPNGTVVALIVGAGVVVVGLGLVAVALSRRLTSRGAP